MLQDSMSHHSVPGLCPHSPFWGAVQSGEKYDGRYTPNTIPGRMMGEPVLCGLSNTCKIMLELARCPWKTSCSRALMSSAVRTGELYPKLSECVGNRALGPRAERLGDHCISRPSSWNSTPSSSSQLDFRTG